MGGTIGFTPLTHSPEEPAFNRDWERLVFGIENVCLQRRLFNLHELRYATESMEPISYFATSYYEHWLAAMEAILVEKDVLDQDEIDNRTRGFMDRPEEISFDRNVPLVDDRIPLAAGDAPPDPRFQPGDRVMTRKDSPKGHTRLPRYARGRTGVVVRVNDAFELPDLAAHDLGRKMERTYLIRFDAQELWGEEADPDTAVFLDVWDSYIERAG